MLRRWIVAAVGGLSSVAALAAQSTPGVEWPRVLIKDGYTRDAAKRSLTGALEWLARPACQTLFSEFTDGGGLALSQRLEALGATPQSYLQLIYFFDGERGPVCKRDRVLAFTEPGSRAVYLCGRDFERASRRDPRETRATIVHEMLHSLGLKENPPAPASITYRVLELCS